MTKEEWLIEQLEKAQAKLQITEKSLELETNLRLEYRRDIDDLLYKINPAYENEISRLESKLKEFEKSLEDIRELLKFQVDYFSEEDPHDDMKEASKLALAIFDSQLLKIRKKI
jgi:hypothetical protein